MTRRTAATVGIVVGLVAGIIDHDAKAHVRGCHTTACDQRIHAKRRAHWKHTHVWEYRWHHLSAADRRWARCIAYWETYGTPWPRKARVAAANGHYGAMQFSPSTAVAAGFKHPVTQTTLYEQLVRGVWWMHRAGASQWATAGKCA